MADAELTLRATLDDDASRGLDQLEGRLRQHGRAAADANQQIGRSAANAAQETGRSASRIVSAYQSASRAASNFARSSAASVGSKLRSDVSGAVGALGRLRDGYRNAGAAASTFSGRAGSIGGALRKVTDQAKRAVGGLRSLASSAAASGRDIGQGIVNGVKSKMGSLRDTVKGGLKTAATVAGAAVGAAFVLQIGAAIKNAGALEQSMGAMDAVFKESSAQMIAWSNEAAKNVGLSKLEYQEMATVLGSSLKNSGMAADEAAAKTNELIALGSDMGSMFGRPTSEAIEAITAALRGENDPIEKFGVSLTAAKVKAQAASMGFKEVGGELEGSAKQAAILALVMDQTKDAAGNFQRETDTFSGSIQILKARWADLTTTWAGYVLPILGVLISTISGPVMSALEGMTNGIGAFFAYLRGGSEADWGVLTGVEKVAGDVGLALHNAFTGGASAARDFIGSVNWAEVGGWFLDIWRAVSPLGPAIQAFALHAGDGMAQLGTTIGTALAIIAPALVPVITGLAQVVAKILELTGPALPVLIPLIGGTILAFKGLTAVVAGVKLLAAGIGLIPVALRAIGPALAAVPVLGWIALAISGFVLMYQKVGWFRDAVDAAMTWIAGAVRNAADWIVEAWRNAGNVLSQIWANTQREVNVVTTFFKTAWALAGEAIRVAIDFIRNTISGVVTWLRDTAVAGWDAAARALGAVMTWLKDTIVTPVWNGIRLAIAVAVGLILTIWDGMVIAYRNVLAPAFTWFRDSVVTPVWNAIRNTISTAWNFIRDNVFNPLMSFIRGPLTSAWNFIRDTIAAIWTAIRNASAQAWAFLRDSVWNPIISFIRGALTSAWNFLRDTVNTIWTAIRTTISNAWNFIRDSVWNPTIAFIRGAFTTAWNFLRDTVNRIWSAIRTTIEQAWQFIRDRVWNPLISFIRGAFTSAWNFLRDTVSSIWGAVRDRLSSGWTTIRTTIFDPLVRFVRETIPNAFSSAKDAVGRVWSGIKDTIGNPINDAVGFIKNRLIGNINKVLTTLKMPTINIGWAAAPAGGSFASGGYTGPGHKYQPAGVVHADEHVIRADSRRSIEHAAPGYLDALNRGGAAALGAAAPGAAVYGGVPSFVHGLAQQVFSSGRLNVSGSAPGYDLAGAIRMVDNATKVSVRSGTGAPNVRVSSGNMGAWWAGYYENGGIRLNDAVAGGMNPAAKRVLVAHEIGHALGLPHSDPGGGQSMMSYANMYQHNSVTPNDVKALSAIYGGTGFASGGGGPDLVGMLMDGIEKAIEALTGRFAKPLGDMISGALKYLVAQAKTFVTKAGESDTGAAARVPNFKNPIHAARGAVLSGYAPGVDSVPVIASRGESVLTPQLTRALGGRNIEAANLSATGNRAGGIDKALSLLSPGSRRSGGGGVVVQMDVTVQGNADMDALAQLRDELEDALSAILEENMRRGY